MENKVYNFLHNLILCNNLKLSANDIYLLDYFKHNPDHILYKDINKLANAAFVSKTSITRFAKKLGFSGFTELKFAVIQDSKQKPLNTLKQYYLNTLMNTSELDKDVKSIIKKITTYNRIIIIGIGTSGLAANEFAYKLHKLGLRNVFFASESYLISIETNNLTINDLCICLSLSGLNSQILEGVEVAFLKKATILSISENHKSPLINYSNAVCFTAPFIKTDVVSISKLIPLITVIDMICTYYLEAVLHLDCIEA